MTICDYMILYDNIYISHVYIYIYVCVRDEVSAYSVELLIIMLVFFFLLFSFFLSLLLLLLLLLLFLLLLLLLTSSSQFWLCRGTTCMHARSPKHEKS